MGERASGRWTTVRAALLAAALVVALAAGVAGNALVRPKSRHFAVQKR